MYYQTKLTENSIIAMGRFSSLSLQLSIFADKVNMRDNKKEDQLTYDHLIQLIDLLHSLEHHCL